MIYNYMESNIPHIFSTRISLSDTVYCHIQNTLFYGVSYYPAGDTVYVSTGQRT